jgi:hypothetical protein
MSMDQPRDRSQTLQLLGSLLVALVIVVLTIAIVTSKFPLSEYPHEDRKERSENSGSGSDRDD